MGGNLRVGEEAGVEAVGVLAEERDWGRVRGEREIAGERG